MVTYWRKVPFQGSGVPFVVLKSSAFFGFLDEGIVLFAFSDIQRPLRLTKGSKIFGILDFALKLRLFSPLESFD